MQFLRGSPLIPAVIMQFLRAETFPRKRFHRHPGRVATLGWLPPSARAVIMQFRRAGIA